MKGKVFLVLFVSLFIIGCASVPKLPADTKFSVTSLKVNLKQKLTVEGYPAQAEFSEIFKKSFIESLKEKNLLADSGAGNAMSVTLNIDYTRQFAGEDTPFPSKSVMAPKVNYTLVVTDKGVEKNRISNAGVLNKGFLGSLKTMGLANDPKSELSDIKKVTDSIANDLNAMK